MKIRSALVTGTVTALAAFMAAVPPAAAGPHHSGEQSRAIATPGRTSALDVKMTMASLAAPVASVRTGADARSIRCNGCDATAVSVHIVLVDTPIRQVRAFNHANSRNQFCTNCTTTAGSYQIVVAGPGHIHVSGEGRALLQKVEAELESTSARGPAALSEAEDAVNKAFGILSNHATLQPSSGHPGLGRAAAPKRPDIAVLRDRSTN